MKKIIIITVIITILCVPVYAQSNEADVNNIINVEDYIPEKVIEIIDDKEHLDPDKLSAKSIISMLGAYLKDSLNSISPFLSEILIVIMISAIFKKINDNSFSLSTMTLLNRFLISLSMMKLIVPLLDQTASALDSGSSLLKAWLPSFTSLILIGGGTASSIASTSAFGAVITFLQYITTDVIGAIVIVFAVLAVFEKTSVFLSELNLTRRIKKHFLTLITFVTTLMISVLTFKSVLGARTDSVTARTVKFASASFVPIVGNALGETLRAISKGVSYTKASIGISSTISILCVFMPCIITMFLTKLILTFASFFASACASPSEASIIDSVCELIDIMISVIICSLLLSLLLVIIFVFITFGV